MLTTVWPPCEAFRKEIVFHVGEEMDANTSRTVAARQTGTIRVSLTHTSSV
jgi:hypothetical protein